MVNNKCIHCGIDISRKSKQCIPCYRRILSYRKQTGKDNPNWKGGKSKHSRGYIYLKKPNYQSSGKNGYIFEHRYIVEQHLGRKLKPKEIIHHKNGVIHDNRIENLEVISQGKHLAIHNLLGTHTPQRDQETGRFIPNPKTHNL